MLYLTQKIHKNIVIACNDKIDC